MESIKWLMRFDGVLANWHADCVSKTEQQVNDIPMFPLERLEKFAIEQAIRLCGNNKGRATNILGISRESRYRRMRQFGIPP